MYKKISFLTVFLILLAQSSVALSSALPAGEEAKTKTSASPPSPASAPTSGKWVMPMNPAWKWKIVSENATPEIWAVEWVPEEMKSEDATRVAALQLIRNRLGGELIDDAVAAMVRLHRTACPKDYLISETKTLDISGFPDAAAREIVIGCLVFTSEQELKVKKGAGEVTSFLFVRKAGSMLITQYSIRSTKGFVKKDFAPNTPNAIELNNASVRMRQIKGVL